MFVDLLGALWLELSDLCIDLLPRRKNGHQVTCLYRSEPLVAHLSQESGWEQSCTGWDQGQGSAARGPCPDLELQNISGSSMLSPQGGPGRAWRAHLHSPFLKGPNLDLRALRHRTDPPTGESFLLLLPPKSPWLGRGKQQGRRACLGPGIPSGNVARPSGGRTLLSLSTLSASLLEWQHVSRNYYYYYLH